MTSIFEEVRERVSIRDAIQYLGLKPTETKGDQLRFACPNCSQTDRRALSVNVGSGKFQCFSGKRGGNDATALVAHVKGISQTQAAKDLKDHFIGSSTEARTRMSEPKGRSDPPRGEVGPLELLGISDNRVFALGIIEEGGRVCFPMRDDRGKVLGTLMIATREDLPLVAWVTEDDDEIAKADAPSSLQQLWRVVKGGA